MDTQSTTQTINILVGPGVPNTGLGPTTSHSPLLPLAIGATILIASLLVWYFLVHRPQHSKQIFSFISKLGTRGFSALLLLTFATALLSNLPLVSAAPTLTLGTDQDTISVTVPQGGGTASITTTLTAGTANSTGYTLTASLSEPEPGIAIKLKGGDITTSTALTPGDAPLTLKTTDSASSNDTTELTLDFAIDGTVTPGKKELKLSYNITDNGLSGPTMQSFTTSDCNALTVYDGSNEEAIVELNDSRGGTTRTYRVAKLADNNCWMLDNLKLGSTTSSITLTPSDTNIASNLTLPQLSTPTFTEEPDEATINDLTDNPHVYGPVPGDTGTGETNYGYLYNWSAATGGESRTSHTENDGNAPYSICPANWRLPTASRIYNEETSEYDVSGDYPALDQALGGTGNSAYSGEPNIAKWQHDGPFKGVFSGFWGGGFFSQGELGGFWSASARPDNAGNAFGAVFSASEVDPAGNDGRGMGASVRCLLQQL